MLESHSSGVVIKFHAVLLSLDQQAADRVRAGGCPRCEGPLYAAPYARKVRGLSDAAVAAGQYKQRLSLCCGRDGCRARATPPSVRFSGRFIYASLAVLTLSLPEPMQRDAQDFVEVMATPQAPAASTRSRWVGWWQSGLMSQPWFQVMCAQLAQPVKTSHSPASLLSLFTGALGERVVQLLVWLAPLTTGSVAPETSRIAMAC